MSDEKKLIELQTELKVRKEYQEKEQKEIHDSIGSLNHTMNAMKVELAGFPEMWRGLLSIHTESMRKYVDEKFEINSKRLDKLDKVKEWLWKIVAAFILGAILKLIISSS